MLPGLALERTMFVSYRFKISLEKVALFSMEVILPKVVIEAFYKKWHLDLLQTKKSSIS